MRTHQFSKKVSKVFQKITPADVEVISIFSSIVLVGVFISWLMNYNVINLNGKDILIMISCSIVGDIFFKQWNNCRILVRIAPTVMSLIPFIINYIFSIQFYNGCYWAFAFLLSVGNVMAWLETEEGKVGYKTTKKSFAKKINTSYKIIDKQQKIVYKAKVK